MSKQKKFDQVLHQKQVDAFIDGILKNQKCQVCEEGFITTKERHEVQMLTIDNKMVGFVHLGCRDKKV